MARQPSASPRPAFLSFGSPPKTDNSPAFGSVFPAGALGIKNIKTFPQLGVAPLPPTIVRETPRSR